MANNKVAIVASLFNGKKVLLEPNYSQQSCAYRYLTDAEANDMKLNLNKKYIWHTAPIYTTVEQGETLFFSTIDVTPVVLSRI